MIVGSCNQSSIETIELSSDEIRKFVVEFAEARNTDLILLKIENSFDSTTLMLFDLSSTCSMNVGDEYGFLVGEEWKNITAPLFKSKIGSTDLYIESGIEVVYKSRKRYHQIRKELSGRIDLCVEKYDRNLDEFDVNPPRTSSLEPWKVVINQSGTHIRTYKSRNEGSENFHYEIEQIRIDSNYFEM